MTGTNKIPMKNLLLHISNVINACDLSSVTSCAVKEYLKHRFKDALPYENDLDIILENVIKSIKLSQALNGDSVHLEEDNYDSLDTYDAFVENEIQDQDKPIKKRITRKIGVCYVLKKGMDSNACKACSYSVRNPFTSKPIRIIKPFSEKKKLSFDSEKRPAEVSEQNAQTTVLNKNMKLSFDIEKPPAEVSEQNAQTTVLNNNMKLSFDSEKCPAEVPKLNAQTTVFNKNMKPKGKKKTRPPGKNSKPEVKKKTRLPGKNSKPEGKKKTRLPGKNSKETNKNACEMKNTSLLVNINRRITPQEQRDILMKHFGKEIVEEAQIINSRDTFENQFIKCTEIMNSSDTSKEPSSKCTEIMNSSDTSKEPSSKCTEIVDRKEEVWTIVPESASDSESEKQPRPLVMRFVKKKPAP